MKKSVSIVFILLMGIVDANESSNIFGYGKVVFIKQNLTIEVEVAKTETQRSRGLMYRDSLKQEKGMLFVFECEHIQRVWMKNTLIPLDIIFISKQGKVVSILKELQPCIKDPCNIYASTKRAKYMLEINAGEIDNKDIAVGQILKIEETVQRPERLGISEE